MADDFCIKKNHDDGKKHRDKPSRRSDDEMITILIIFHTNDELKNIAQIKHSRHRFFSNFIVNTIVVLAAYCFFLRKSSVYLKHYHDNQLVLF